MTEAAYCSQVCLAQCCRTRAPIIAPQACPKLTADNLCSIYEMRLGFTYKAITGVGNVVTCVCTTLAKAAKHLPEKVAERCCVLHPELLEAN